MAKQTKVKTKKALKTNLSKTSPKSMAKTSTKSTGLTVKVFDIQGKSHSTVTLPKEIFGQKPNPKLLARAIRVYQANSIPRAAHTKTRGEVRGGGAKPWRQKGTGKARAGSIRSPLWRGGGITFGPRYHDAKLVLPKKQKRLALISALSSKATGGQIKVISNIENIKPKTKVVANLLGKLAIKGKALVVISQKSPNVNLATRNIPTLETDLVSNLNAYKILKNNQLLISKEALAEFK